MKKSGGEELTPPTEPASPDPPIEYKADDTPLGKVPGCRWGNHSSSSKQGREDNIAERGARVTTGKEPLDKGAQEANQPEVVGPGVSIDENWLARNHTAK